MAGFGHFGLDGLGRSLLVGIHPETTILAGLADKWLWIPLEGQKRQSGVSLKVR
jgi:hypothetical protein